MLLADVSIYGMSGMKIKKALDYDGEILLDPHTSDFIHDVLSCLNKCSGKFFKLG